MAKQVMVIYLKYLIVCTVLSTISAKSYDDTAKTRHTKYSSSTPPPGSGSLVTPAGSLTVTEDNGVPVYKVINEDRKTCILLKTDALIEVSFKPHSDDDDKGSTFIPDNAIIEGDCRYEDSSSMKLGWGGDSLLINFAKTPGGERWYISNLELSVGTDSRIYHNIKAYGERFKLSHREMLIPTPVGKSYSCEEISIPLTPDRDDNLPSGLNGTLLFRAFQLQPFMYKDDNFGPPFECNAVKGFRDETAPIAVGSTLAIAVLGTIAGYGVFRYLKVKKVQYNTME